MDFVHLHTHSHFSLLDSTDTLAGLLDKAEENEMEALALTDHGNIGGAVKFYSMAKQRGIKPIIGCELYVAPNDRREKRNGVGEKGEPKYYHLVVWAANNQGYKNLVKLSSKAYTEGFYYKPRVDHELLERHSEGLIASSACKSGEVPKALLAGNYEKAIEKASKLSDIFGEDNFFIELQDQGIEGQEELNEKLKKVADELELPLVATNDVHYLEKEDELAHEVLLNIQANKKLSDDDRRRYEGNEYHFKSESEMAERFSDNPEALENTAKIAERCDVELDFDKTYLPSFEIPEKHEEPINYLSELVYEGAEKRWGEITEEIENRLERELGVIEEMGFPTYFLIVKDFISFAKKNDIPVGPGRGSAAASAVAYCLEITDIDPLEHGLLFERFLNPGRVSMPDIDIDFCKEGRDRVIDYVVQKYGEEKVAQIATFDTMAARSAVRDVARVMDIPYDEADEIAKAIPPRTSLEEALSSVGELKERYEENEEMEKLFDISLKLEGLMRNASTHAAGVVIAPGRLTDYTPLQKLSDGEIVTQFDMDDLEKIGLLKMDFLGLRNLTIIDHAREIIENKTGEEVDVRGASMEDEKTFNLLKDGNTAGVFQLESSGMQGLLTRLEPENFQDIIASNALYRPGPLESGMTEDYIKRKHGEQPVEYPYEDQDLKEVLEETYGLPIYQEQIMKMAQILAGFSLGQADKLRKAMGKKKESVMAEMKQKFIEGCMENGIEKREATDLFSDIEKFSRYGFNKAHSTAYAYISYWTAWLKANYPAEYMASLLTSVSGNEDKVRKYVSECEEMGHEVLPPDINESDAGFTPISDGKIRFGLGAIKYVGTDTVKEITKSRRKNGSFESFFGLCRRVSSSALNSEALESLIKVGALYQFGTRKYLLSKLNEGLEVNSLMAGKGNTGQKSFFDEGDSLTNETKPREEMEEFPKSKLLRFEKEFLGLFISGDPLEDYRPDLNLLTTCSLDEASPDSRGDSFWLGGRISNLSKTKTKNGDPMAFMTLNNGKSEREFIIFPGIYERVNGSLEEDRVIMVNAHFGSSDDEKLIVDRITTVKEAWELERKKLSVELDATIVEEDLLDELARKLSGNGGETELNIKISDARGDRYSLVRADNSFSPQIDKKLIENLEGISSRINLNLRLPKGEK